ncbi:MAG: CoA transferase, partial [Actinobacteria bacterium]|nr:CoA transferase [Actinomycetota bacterium]
MRPLAGTRVVSLAVNTPGPVAAARLRELGAEVTKVEPPGGDPLERVSRPWYDELRAGQEVVRLDLKSDEGRAALDELLAPADVLLTSHRPSALSRLGLAWSDLHARFPRLVQVAIVGFAAPDQELPGHDLTYLASRGLLAPPELPRTLIADLGGAERAVAAVLGLLLARERGDGAGYAEVALAGAADFFA